MNTLTNTLVDPSPSSSSSSFPHLLENETELTIPHFWRSTKPRQCLRSEIRSFQGLSFRLLVWPQGSKQTNPNYLSAFVEVVPDPTWPSDWLIPAVSYRISIMNHKQKWIYAKADTWSFSYVCPDRGWHTLLDTRYVNRKDGYLSADGGLTIRASVLPRFGKAVSVLPSSSLGVGAAGGLGQEHIVGLIGLLHGISGFKKLVYHAETASKTVVAPTCSTAPGTDCVAGAMISDLVAMEKELDSICYDLRHLMETVTNKKPPTPGAMAATSSDSITQRMFKSSGLEAVTESLRSRHLKSLVVCDQLAEVIDEITKSMAQVTQQTEDVAPEDASSAVWGGTSSEWRATLAGIRARLVYGEVFKKLFLNDATMVGTSGIPAEASRAKTGGTVLSGFQRAFGLLDTVRPGERRWRELEKVSLEISRSLRNMGGDVFSTPATPEQIFTQVLATLRSEMSEADRKLLDEMFVGSLGEGVFDCVTVQNGRATNVEKMLATGRQTVEGRTLVLSGEGEPGDKFERKPKVVWMTVANKIKDRLDVNETVEIAGEKFRLHGFLVGHGGNGSDSSYAGNFQHYSVMMRRGRKAPWTRIEENEIILTEANKAVSSSQTAPISWVFSPEFPVAAMLWVREADEDALFERGVDVRHVAGGELIPKEYWDRVEAASTTVVPAVSTPAAAAGQITVTFVTEKDLLAPMGFFSVFKNALSLTLGGPEAGRRKLLVRKDITVTRLCDAVEEFFKIPASLVRLYALHYFADVQQERFEVMAESRSVASYLSQHPVPGNFSVPTPSLVVLVSRRPEMASSITLWVKYIHTQSLSLVSGGLLTVDVSQSFSSYYPTIEAKFPAVKLNHSPGPSTLAVFEEFGPRLVEKKREKIPISDENLTDGDVIIFADLAVLTRPKISSKELKSANASAVSWVEQLLPLFLKRKKHEIASDKRNRFLDVLLNEDEEDDEEEDETSDDEEISDHSKKPKISEDLSEPSEAEISRQRLLRYLREAHRHLKLGISDQLKTSGCFLCGSAGEAANVTLVCSERCVSEKLSVHLLCLADLMGDGRPLDCVLTPNCTGHLESGISLKKKQLIHSSPIPPQPEPPVMAPEQMSDSIRLRFLAACPPPLQPPKRAPRGFVPPPLPELPTPVASTASARRRKKGEANEADKALWWEACKSVWNGDLEIANEFILAAEVGGQPRADDTAACLFFHWKSQLTKSVVAEVESTELEQAALVAALADVAAAPTSSKKKKKTKAETEVLTTATSTPVVAAAPIAEESTGVFQEDWQPVQRQKTPKTATVPTAPVLAPPTVAVVAKSASPPAHTASTVDTSEVNSEISSAVKKAIAAGKWKADEPCSESSSSSTSVEAARVSLLGEALRQFCLPASLVFVFSEFPHVPARTVTAVAPTGTSADEQIEGLLGAAAICDAKLERAFAAPAQNDRVRWFMELDNEEEAARVIEYLKQNLKIWETPDRGTLVDIS
jgi:hypothetical protein